uniref:Uncharacterized protein n=1 Tax=Romanomermis culicivorax TaxID=13658 RepID=A0A915J2D0_ROMCU
SCRKSREVVESYKVIKKIVKKVVENIRKLLKVVNLSNKVLKSFMMNAVINGADAGTIGNIDCKILLNHGLILISAKHIDCDPNYIHVNEKRVKECGYFAIKSRVI